MRESLTQRGIGTLRALISDWYLASRAFFCSARAACVVQWAGRSDARRCGSRSQAWGSFSGPRARDVFQSPRSPQRTAFSFSNSAARRARWAFSFSMTTCCKKGEEADESAL